MGLFFKTEPSTQLKEAFREALAAPPLPNQDRGRTLILMEKAYPELKSKLSLALDQPPPPPNQQEEAASNMAGEVPSAGERKIVWGRFWAIMIVLALVFCAGVYAAHDDKMKDWSGKLLELFGGLVTLFLGLFVGEAQKK